MIKRSGAILLTVLYLVTVFGFALNLHYCFGVLASVKVDAPAKSCKMLTVKSRSCCQDKQIDVKVKDAHQAETTQFLAGLFAIELPKYAFAGFASSAQLVVTEKLSDRGPPDLVTAKVPTIIKNCTYRI